MKNFIRWAQEKFEAIDFTNETERVHVQFIFVYSVLAFVGFFMTAINYYTGWHNLEKLTLLYGFLCLISFCIEFFLPGDNNISRFFFVCSTIITFTSFAIVGEPEGFSVLWILLLPTCGFFLFRIKYGLIVVFVEFAIVVFLYWTSIGRSFLFYEYTETFCQRFPIIYISFMFIGVLFEKVRSDTQKELNEVKSKYENLYNHDMLTGLFNRYGFNSSMDDFLANRHNNAFAFAIIDLDHFKNINDTYGHQQGDVVLKKTAERICKYVGNKGICSRWGGEEFSILFYTNEYALDICNQLIEIARVEPIEIENDKVIVRFSIGLTFVPDNKAIDAATLVTSSDTNLYDAKEEGRDRIVYTIYED